MSRNVPSKYDDVIDSRDIIERIETLQGERDNYETADAWEAENPDEAAELRILEKLAEEGEGSPDWKYGETLIRESYFRDYAEQLADDIGAINRDASWPNDCIDWERAARELRVDYIEVDFDGVTYLIRA